MRITKLNIEKYKSIEEFSLEKPGKIHIFIGENNAGKTNIIDSIHQLYTRDKQRLGFAKTELEIEFALGNKFGKLFTVYQRGIKKEFRIDSNLITINKAKRILENNIIRLSAINKLDSSKLQSDYEVFSSKYKKRFKIFHDTLTRQFKNIKLPKNILEESFIEENSKSTSLARLGDGFKQVFIILMYLFNHQYTILLLEEPEIHLHPALVKKLLRILETQNLDNQIFITTHSPLFIHPGNLHRLFRVTKESGITKVHSPRISGQQLDHNRLKQELNAENTEMFFADRVLLVEGPSDRILMRGLIDRFYKGKSDIKVIQIYGKSNVDLYAELLEIYHIPYIVMLDRDALYGSGSKKVQEIVGTNFTESEQININQLKRQNIFILPNGNIELNYPKKYQRRRKHKPQNALYAATRITRSEFNSPKMRYIKEVIDNL